MRLDARLVPSIVGAVRDQFGSNAGVWLFGSRTDDEARGGDIDLYIETDLDRDLVARRIRLAMALEALIGERRVDLVVRPRSRAPAPIDRIARRDGIPLHEPCDGA